MFKDPKDGPLPVLSIPLAQRPIGKLAICAQRSSNPKEEEIDQTMRDYSHVLSPLTRISNTNTRQAQLSRWMRLRKLSAKSHETTLSVAGASNQIDFIGMARIHEREWTSFISTPTISTGTQTVRATNTGTVRTKTILDTGCDWSVVAQGWQVIHDYNEVFHCQGAFFTEPAKVSCRLVDAMTIFAFDGMNRPACLVRANRVLYCDDPAQLETLLDPIQLMAAGHAVDLTPIRTSNRTALSGAVGFSSKGCVGCILRRGLILLTGATR
jgi:hypothetical protein